MTKKYRMADITLTAGTPDRCARHHNHQRPSAALRSAGRWLGLFALLALAQAGLATTITYSSYVATNSADTSWVSPAGAVSLQGFNYGGDDTSYGEVTWADCTNPNGGGAACGNNQTSPFTTYFSVPGVWGNNHTGFYPSGPALLNTGAWSSRTDCKLDIYGFTVGKHYRVQFVVADDRSDGYGRAVTIKGADSIAGQDSAAVQYGYMNGQYAVVTADFVADETGYHFFPEASSGGGTQINAVQILEVSGFAVTYNGNGNTGGTVPVDGSSPYASNVVVTVLGNINGLVRVGGSFTNWNTTATGTGTGYNSGDTFNITNNITLYAQWLALPSQTLTWTAAVDNNWDESTANWTNNAGYNLWLNNSINPDSAIFDAQGAGTVNVAFANTFYASNLTFNAAGYTISGGTLTLGNTPILTVNSNVTISSILAGSGGLTKTGNGTLILSSANSYAGGTTVNGGTLELGASGSAGKIRGTLTINSGATARLTGTDALGYQSGTAVTQVNINGGTLDAATTGNNGLIANFSLTGGTVSGTGRMDFSTGYGITTLASGTSSVFSAPMMLRDGNNMSINVADGEASTDLLFSGAIVEQNDNSGITKSSDGTLSLTGNNTYSGTTTVSGGTLAFSGGTNSLGNASVNNGTLTFSGNAAVTMSSIGVQDWQTVQFQDNADVTLSSGLSVSHLASRFNLFGGTLRTPSIAGSMVVWQMNLGSIHLAGTRIVATADNDNFITLNGWESWNVIFVKPEGAIFDTAGHDIGIHYTLANEGGAGTLTKLGAGTLTLYAGDSYAGIYSGPTTVSNGTLLVNGTIGNSAVSVASGATLGGTSTLAGAVTLESGAMLAPGAATNQIGTLTLSGTAPALSGCGLVADVSATSGVCDLLALSGAADLTGLTVTVKTTGTLPSANTYVLISSTGTLSGTPTLAGDLPSSAWRLSVKNGNALVLEKIVGTMILLY